jgi:two-component system response regulator GlrR
MNKSSAHLLVVDDDLNILKMLKMRLESEGYQVQTASEIKAAKDLAATNEYELAILDLKFSGGSGIDLMRNIIKRVFVAPEMTV